MTKIKVAFLFLSSSMKKEIGKDSADFLCIKSELCCFRSSILKQPKGQIYFYDPFPTSFALPLNSAACRN